MEENTWSCKCRTFKISGSFSRERHGTILNELIRSDPKESKVGKDLAKGRVS